MLGLVCASHKSLDTLQDCDSTSATQQWVLNSVALANATVGSALDRGDLAAYQVKGSSLCAGQQCQTHISEWCPAMLASKNDHFDRTMHEQASHCMVCMHGR